MAVTLAATAAIRCSLGYNGTGNGVCGWNNEPYDPNTNPGGMDGNGVGINWVNMAADLVALGASSAMAASIAASYSANSTGWTVETHTPIQFISSTQFSVGGGVDLSMSIYKVNRALALTQSSSGYCYVSGASYNSGTGKTTVTVMGGVAVDSGLSALSFGQDPANDPYTSALVGATATTSGTSGPVPAALAGQENSHLCGDATFHDAAVDAQIWS